jgi:hypothetical protein
MSETNPYKWYVGNGAQPENYSEGPFDTREIAIEVGREEFTEFGFTILEAFKGAFSPPSAADLMEEMLDRWSDDDMGREDCAEFEGGKDAIKAAEADLDALLNGWFQRHAAIMPKPWCFYASRNEEYFPPEEEAA